MIEFKIEDINNVQIYTPGEDSKLNIFYKRVKDTLNFIPCYQDFALKNNDSETICEHCGEYYNINDYHECPICHGEVQTVSEDWLIDHIYWILDDSPENIVVINGIQIP